LNPLLLAILLVTIIIGCSDSKKLSRKNHILRPSNSDPLYIYAWHLENKGQFNYAKNQGIKGVDINVKEVIDSGIRGAGVTIVVSDTGIEHTHEDLFRNYVPGISKNFLLPSSPYKGDPLSSDKSFDEAHGTAVTGIIAAVGWNGFGSRGVAPSAKFGGYNFISKGVKRTQKKLLAQMTGDYDIFNYSYGQRPCIYQEMGSVAATQQAMLRAFIEGVSKLRNGKGAIYVKAGGNEYLSLTANCGIEKEKRERESKAEWFKYYLGNSVWQDMNVYPYTMVVGAVNAQGKKASYSSPGPNIWISALGGEDGQKYPAVMTTDFTGCSSGIATSEITENNFENNKYSENPSCKYTARMNGTSAAAPIVSGVVALILESNPDLSWRDVKHIVAMTAKRIDPDGGPYKHPDPLRNLEGHTYQQGWVQNAAGNYFHNYYGFGLIDAAKAVKMAQSYEIDLGEFVSTKKLDGSWIYDSGTISKPIPDNSPTGVESSLTIEQDHDYIVEAVQVRVSVTHNYVENLGLQLTSPAGTKSILTNINSFVLDKDMNNVLLLTNAFYGESSAGTWTLKVVDGSSINADGTTNGTGTLTNWKINILGHEPVESSDSDLPSAGS